jgi:RNA polymerase sigma-70 factor (ECF subfamily)
VRQILNEMPQKDRNLLRAVFLEEKEKDTVCREFGVDRNYLRVLLHRAKDKFKVLYEKDQMGMERRVTS